MTNCERAELFRGFLLGLPQKAAFIVVAALWPEWTWRREECSPESSCPCLVWIKSLAVSGNERKTSTNTDGGMPEEKGGKKNAFLGRRRHVAYSELNIPGWCGSVGRDVHAEGLQAFVLHSGKT